MVQNEKRYLANRSKKSAVRTAEKKLRKAVDDNDLETAKSQYKIFSSLIDRAAKRNIYHKNTASRKKSRLAKLLRKASTAS